MAKGTRHFAAAWATAWLIAAIFPAPATAWGGLGHRLICAVALMQLNESDRREVDRLASGFRDPDGRGYRYFTQGCTFADAARARSRAGAVRWKEYARFARWHFMNAPRGARRPTRGHCADDCVVAAIDYHFRRFANHDLGERTRAEAMLFMAHWIADAHQPLHVAFEDDLGGNLVEVAPNKTFRQRNLHAVWDRGILENAVGGGDWWEFATRLSDSITAGERRRWGASGPLEWAQESFNIATGGSTRYCTRRAGKHCESMDGPIVLDANYQMQMEDIVLDRVRQAGVRLADLLRHGLSR